MPPSNGCRPAHKPHQFPASKGEEINVFGAATVPQRRDLRRRPAVEPREFTTLVAAIERRHGDRLTGERSWGRKRHALRKVGSVASLSRPNRAQYIFSTLTIAEHRYLGHRRCRHAARKDDCKPCTGKARPVGGFTDSTRLRNCALRRAYTSANLAAGGIKGAAYRGEVLQARPLRRYTRHVVRRRDYDGRSSALRRFA